tara:strand:+ start:62 stop:292 length:231 start_codon:yes stop_codon:yes gene_type:complete
LDFLIIKEPIPKFSLIKVENKKPLASRPPIRSILYFFAISKNNSLTFFNASGLSRIGPISLKLIPFLGKFGMLSTK